jgi:anti-anti-sigma factor
VSTLLVRTSLAPTPPTLVTIAGEIDIASVPALRHHLRAVPACHTVLELSGLRLLSAAGVTELVDLRERLTRADATLAIAAAPPVVRRVLAITRFDGTIVVTDTIDDAVRLVTVQGSRRRPSLRGASSARACGAPRHRSAR